VTHLRQLMLDELQRRNYSPNTVRSYIHAVEEFATYFRLSPEQLGPEHVRDYQVHLFRDRKLSPRTIEGRAAALRFLFVKTSAATLLEVARDPKHLGADIGLLSVLHTWGQNLQHHPHVHCVVPAGGLAIDGSRWIAAARKFFLPVRVLSRFFRGKFTAGLKQLLHEGKLQFHGSLQELAEPERFSRFLRQMYAKEWVVYAKPPFGGAEHFLNYLARYTHRVAISNHRLVSFQDDRVSFRWKDYAAGSQQKVMTVSADEFLRRFLIHVLPKGLVRIRHFGLFANRRRAASLLRCRVLLSATKLPQQLAPTSQLRCPLCSEPMLVTERMTSQQLSLRNAWPLYQFRVDSS